MKHNVKKEKNKVIFKIGKDVIIEADSCQFILRIKGRSVEYHTDMENIIYALLEYKTFLNFKDDECKKLEDIISIIEKSDKWLKTNLKRICKDGFEFLPVVD